MSNDKAEDLLTLTEVSKRTNISMPTLQRYKKLFQDRIPSVGEGRKQRYPEEALPVFKQIKKENIKKRGRPKKKRSEKEGGEGKKEAAGKKKGAGKAAAKKGGELMTLAEIGRITGISYPTLLRYVKAHLDDIPHVGEGRKRRYKPEAVEVFEKLRARSGRKKAKGAATAADAAVSTRLGELEKAQREMARKLDSILSKLEKPIKVTLQR